MLELTPFSWLPSNGWLVLSGRADALGEIRALALSRHNAGGAIAYISLADDLGDALMDDMAELGAASGYLVDLDEQDNNEVYERLSTATMIVIEADGERERLGRLLRRTAVHAMKEALNHGALILFEDAAASTAGQYMLGTDDQVDAGLDFLHNAMVLTDVSSVAEHAALRSARVQLPDTVFVGLASGSALVLGPDEQLETWGERQVAISLGDPARINPIQYRDRATE